MPDSTSRRALLPPLFLIVAVCLISRLPVMLRPAAVLDGDECVVATMAKYLYEGRTPFRLFFWGQDYGFSLLECLCILPFYAVFGYTTLAVQCGMLLLWTAGCCFFLLCLRRLAPRSRLPLLLTLLLAAHPAWALWALKARGGYLTAFCLSNLSLWMLLRRPGSQGACLAAGLLVCLVYQSQRFWLAGLLPTALCLLWHHPGRWRNLLWFGLPLAAGTLAFALYKAPYRDIAPVLLHPAPAMVPHLVGRLPLYFFGSLHGTYRFADYAAPNAFCAAASLLLCGLVVVLLGLGLRSLVVPKERRDWLWLSSLAFLPLLATASFFFVAPEGRYLLPVTGCALLSLQLLLRERADSPLSTGAAATAVLVAFVATCTFYSYQEEPLTETSLRALLDELKRRKIAATFATDCMLPWQITFYSNETVLSRMVYVPGRYPAYTRLVDRALDEGRPTAVVGYTGEFLALPLQPAWANSDLFLAPSPAKDVLLQSFYFQ